MKLNKVNFTNNQYPQIYNVFDFYISKGYKIYSEIGAFLIDYLISGISPMFFRPIVILNYIIGNTFVLNFFFISLGAFALIEWTIKLFYFAAVKTHLLGGE